MPKDSPQWYVLRTQPNHELTAALLLSTRFHQYLPLYNHRTRWHDRVKVLRRPLFPGYVFCRFDFTRRHEVLATAGILREGILQFGGVPATLTDTEVESIRELEKAAAVPSQFVAGCKIRVLDGALAGMTGVLTSIDNEMHIAVEVPILGRIVAVRLTVPEWAVERVA